MSFELRVGFYYPFLNLSSWAEWGEIWRSRRTPCTGTMPPASQDFPSRVG